MRDAADDALAWDMTLNGCKGKLNSINQEGKEVSRDNKALGIELRAQMIYNKEMEQETTQIEKTNNKLKDFFAKQERKEETSFVLDHQSNVG